MEIEETVDEIRKMNLKKKGIFTKGILLVFLFVLIVALSIFMILKISDGKHNTFSAPDVARVQTSEGQGSCRAGWSFYKQDVIGISFCYPKEWGSVVTDPTGPITKLENLSLDGYLQEDGAFNDHFTLAFDRGSTSDNNIFQSGLMMTFFNDKYDRNAPAEVNSSITSMKSSASACGYKRDGAFYIEHYTGCENNIQTSVWEHNNMHPNTFLSDFAYKKISNGYFDDVLIQNQYANKEIQFAGEPNRQFGNMDEILAQMGISKEFYTNERADFEAFLGSIKSFAPSEKTKAAFKNVPDEDARITAIRNYFWFLSNGELEDAKAMEVGGQAAHGVFSVQSIYEISAHDIKNVGGDNFTLLADCEADNTPVVRYGLKMSVSGGRLTTNAIEKFIGTEVQAGDSAVFTAVRGDKVDLVLKKGDKEIIVDQDDASQAELSDPRIMFTPFNSIKLSISGNYLSYSVNRTSAASRQEGYKLNVYDIVNEKFVLLRPLGDYSLTFDFTQDEKHFFLCTEPDYYPTLAGEVYATNDFKKEFDALGGENRPYQNVKCKYDKNEQAIAYTLKNPSEAGLPDTKEVKYKLEM